MPALNTFLPRNCSFSKAVGLQIHLLLLGSTAKPKSGMVAPMNRILVVGVLVLGLASSLAQPGTQPRFSGITPEPHGVRLAWEGTSSNAVAVQFQDALDDGLWRIPAGFPLPIQASEWVDGAATNKSAFYRLEVGPGVADRGLLLTNIFRSTMSRQQLTFIFALAGIPITPQYNVHLQKLIYETVAPDGTVTTASGALMLPDAPGTPLPLVSYQHGTLTLTNDAPSNMNINGEAGIGIALASVGYAAVVPDYLGLGESRGLHPYHHTRSEATACVDMLRAARLFCASNSVPLTNKLFLLGYSQGGHATLALLKELETFHTNEFTVTACAGMAGAYDLSGVTAADFLSNRQQPNPYYFLYLLASYQSVYRLAPSLGDLLAPPYDSILPPLMGGQVSGGELNSQITNNPTAILKPEILEGFKTNPRHPLRLALEHNDLIRWRPQAPLRLYHCPGDQDVVIENSRVALASFHAMGASQVELIEPLPGGDHGSCAQPSMLHAKAWFDSLR